MNFDCLDCKLPVHVDKHGRCPRCGSNAIAPSSGTTWQNMWCEHVLVSKYGERRCHSRWSVERDGRRLCKTHDPEAAKIRLQRAQERRTAQAMKLIAELANA